MRACAWWLALSLALPPPTYPPPVSGRSPRPTRLPARRGPDGRLERRAGGAERPHGADRDGREGSRHGRAQRCGHRRPRVTAPAAHGHRRPRAGRRAARSAPLPRLHPCGGASTGRCRPPSSCFTPLATPLLPRPPQRMLEALVPVVESPLLRVVLANLWLTRSLVVRVLSRSPAGAAMTRTTTALTVFHAGDKTNTVRPLTRPRPVAMQPHAPPAPAAAVRCACGGEPPHRAWGDCRAHPRARRRRHRRRGHRPPPRPRPRGRARDAGHVSVPLPFPPTGA